MEYGDIQDILDRLLGKKLFDFSDCVQKMVSGNWQESPGEFLEEIVDVIVSGVSAQKDMFLFVIVLVIFCGLFTNFSEIFQGKQVAKTAFYVTYMLMFTALSATFFRVQEIASQSLYGLLEYLRALVPSFFMAVAFTNKVAGTGMIYEFTLFVIAVVDYVVVKILFPVVKMYFWMSMANQLSEEDFLSKSIELLERFVRFVLKTLVGVIVGMEVIQGMLIPLTGQVEKSILLRASSLIPGVGAGANAVAQTVLSAGIILKNAVGVAGIFGVLLVCIVPIGQLFLYQILYEGMAAVVQPISEKSIICAISATAKSIKLLVAIVAVAAMTFIISLAVICSFTNINI